MSKLGRLLCLALPAAGAWACGEPEHPDLVPACDPAVMDCSVTPPVTGAGGGGGNVDGGAGSAGAGNVVVEVGIYGDDRFSPGTSALYARSAIVEAEGSAGRVRGDWAGSTPVVLQGVTRKPVNWFSVQPLSTTDDAMLTLHPVDTTAQSEVDLLLVRPSVLDLIFGILTLPVERLPTRGHAVVFVKDAATLEPVQGVRVTQPQAEFVAYAVNGAWSDSDLDVTGVLGLALLGNVDAGEFPVGSPRQLTLSGAVTGSAELRVVRNGVTVADVLVAR